MSGLPINSLAFAFLQAARIVAAVFAGRSLADGLLARVEAEARPAVQDLVYGSLRRYGRGDFLLARLLARPLDVPEVRALLLLASARGDVSDSTLEELLGMLNRRMELDIDPRDCARHIARRRNF